MVPVRRHARYWRAYLAGGGLVLAFFLIKPRPREIDAEKHASKQERHSDQLEKKQPPGHKYKDYDHPSEGEHRTTEQFAWRGQQFIAGWTLAAAVFAAALATATVIFTACQTSIVQQSYVATSRPWVFIDEKVSTGGLVVNPTTGPFVTMTVYANALGQRPAQRVSAYGVVIPNSGDVDPIRRQQSICDKSKRGLMEAAPSGAVKAERTLFPGQQGQPIEVFVDNENHEFANLMAKGEHTFIPTVIGCISYIDGDFVVHRTGFIYDIYDKVDAFSSSLKPLDFSRSVIPAGELVFRINNIGNGPAN